MIFINLRNVCLKMLEEVYNDGLFVNDVIDAYFNLYDFEKSEKSFINRLVYGTLENHIKIDYIIGQFSKTPLKKIKKTILYILRMSLYQILYMDQIPDYSVCDEAVSLVKKRKMGDLSGFVNGMLRNIIRNKAQIKYPDRSQIALYLSIMYSFPMWLIELLMAQYNAEIVENICIESLKIPKLCIRLNRKFDKQIVIKTLEDEGVTVSEGHLLPYALYIEDFNDLKALKAFKAGMFQVQDESSMLVGEVAMPEKESIVLDLCAAPGGKTTHLAELLDGTGKVYSRDVSFRKLTFIEENCKRLGLENVDIKEQDALIVDVELEKQMDIVLTDVPCSGLGIIKKKPDIKYNASLEGIRSLIEIQRNIIDIAKQYVKPNGILIYSTCTINKAENEENIKWFLENNKNFELEPIKFDLKAQLIDFNQPFLQILPLNDTSDGFFIAKLRRMS